MNVEKLLKKYNFKGNYPNNSSTVEETVAQIYEELWEKRLEEHTPKRYVSEKYQLGSITKFLDKNGIDYIFEGFLYGIPIDILCVQRDKTIAIELKSRNFRKGIYQAKRNASFVDYSFLSVWEKNVTERLVNRVKSLPIGLLAVDTKVKCLSSPSQNEPNPYVKNKIIKMVKNEV